MFYSRKRRIFAEIPVLALADPTFLSYLLVQWLAPLSRYAMGGEHASTNSHVLARAV
jgi:hypothetical protein